MPKRKITDINLYELLEILSTATEQEIKKAYRKKALKCHPDKNPDDPNAADRFLELSDALEILTDAKAREAYDRTLQAKELAKERLKGLDAKRRKFKEDLERREQEAKEARTTKGYNAGLSDEERLRNEIDRLKKEGSRILREEQDLIRQQLNSTKSTFPAASKETKPTPAANAASAAQSFEDFEAFEANILKKLAAAAADQKRKAELERSKDTGDS